MFRVTTLAIQAEGHGRELAICEDKVATGVVAIDEHAQGLERYGEGGMASLVVSFEYRCTRVGSVCVAWSSYAVAAVFKSCNVRHMFAFTSGP
ncbi:hypothetical protein GGR34_001468 [Microvirga flocculans]|uniref:Uncharacterized protein n=1 Tax=Microvirga flocculans TaxID=217168 RepID=A0A7W6IES6_9HYPH|nr:hypothetical protein [Microvirga flocculans]